MCERKVPQLPNNTTNSVRFRTRVFRYRISANFQDIMLPLKHIFAIVPMDFISNTSFLTASL